MNFDVFRLCGIHKSEHIKSSTRLGTAEMPKRSCLQQFGYAPDGHGGVLAVGLVIGRGESVHGGARLLVRLRGRLLVPPPLPDHLEARPVPSNKYPEPPVRQKHQHLHVSSTRPISVQLVGGCSSAQHGL